MKVIALFGLDREIWKTGAKLFGEKMQCFSGNVNRNITERRILFEKIINQQGSLRAVARAEFNQIECRVVVGCKGFVNCLCLRLKNLRFRPRQIVFGQLHNLLKQTTAFVVVKVFRRKKFRIGGQTVPHILGEGILLNRSLHKVQSSKSKVQGWNQNFEP